MSFLAMILRISSASGSALGILLGISVGVTTVDETVTAAALGALAQ